MTLLAELLYNTASVWFKPLSWPSVTDCTMYNIAYTKDSAIISMLVPTCMAYLYQCNYVG